VVLTPMAEVLTPVAEVLTVVVAGVDIFLSRFR
jgi:hypothetical protein